MAGACYEELAELLNPTPRFPDPEDHLNQEDRLPPNHEEQDDEEEELPRPGTRALTLLDTDPRYRGKKVTRKQLLGSEQEELEWGDDEDYEDDEEESEGEEQRGEENESGGDDDDDDDDEEEKSVEEEQEEGGAGRGPEGVDFLRLTEGMDDLGVSEEEEEGSDDEMEEEEEEEEGSDEVEEEGESVRTFSKEEVQEEVQRGRAVQQQLALWDQLLEGRIRLQKVLVSANQLPQPLSFPEFQRRGGADLVEPLRTTHKALKGLQGALLQLQDQLLLDGEATRCILQEEEEQQEEEEEEQQQEATTRKRRLGLAEYPGLMAKRFAAFRPFQDSVLQRWEDRTRLGGGFSTLQRGVLLQVQQVLEDPERLLRRTQTPRSHYKVLGKALALPPDTPLDQGAETQLQPNTHLKQVDEDVFDDDDFYHTLLRELIERRTSTADPNQQVALGRQWLSIQKLRSRIKKKVDTKASKGRKVRFQVHSKLLNFMAPMDTGSMSHEARSELFRGLFSQGPAHSEATPTWTDVTTHG